MNARLRAAARRVPGLSRLYWAAKHSLILRRGLAPIDFPGVRLRATTREIVRKRLHPRAKEPWTVDWLESSVRDGDVVYDVGANVGAYALIAAHLADTTVVALEPAFANFASLCENILLNGVGERVTPLPVVLSDSTTLAWLACDDTAAGAAMHTLGGEGAHVAYRQPVLAYTLDDLIPVFGLPVPTVVKIDVDGAEAAVLAGARATLARPELRTLLIEVDGSQTDDVQRLLAAAGLELTARFDEREGQPLPGIWYGVYERTGS